MTDIQDSSAITRCRLCNGEAGRQVFPFETGWNGKIFRFCRCRRCGSAFVEPAPSDADLRAAYSLDAYHDAHYALDDQGTQTTELSGVLKFLKPGGTLLDFGCGNGHFLIEARRLGFVPAGVEIDDATCAMAERNSRCSVMTAADFRSASARYDIIHLGDVLEHLPDPIETMRDLETRLAVGGRFFLEGPLEDNFSLVNVASRLFGTVKKWLGRGRGDFPPLHLIRTTAGSQLHFFTDVLGFEVHCYRFGDDGWPYRSRGDRLLRPRSAAHFLKMIISNASMAVTSLGRTVGLRWGNRFAVVAAPNDRRDPTERPHPARGAML